MNGLKYIVIGLIIFGLQQKKTFSQDKETWEFKVKISVEYKTAKEYGNIDSIRKIVKNAFTIINKKYNSPGVFNAYIKFIPDSIGIFKADSTGRYLCFEPHPNHLIHVVVDGYDTGGGYYGIPYRSIYHAWKMDQNGGPFASKAIDGLTHEFGHSRGAMDIYACIVDKNKNPVNNKGFKGPRSIMNSCYNETEWDKHTIAVINMSADSDTTVQLKDLFPEKIKISAINKQGQALMGDTIKLYPVKWYSYTVNPEPIIVNTLNPQGELVFDLKKNNPMIIDKNTPFNIQGSNNMYFNMLVQLKHENKNYYKWMPIFEIQNAKIKDHSDEYSIEFSLSED